MPALSQSNLHLDILMGRDEMLECPDFMMPGMSSSARIHFLVSQTNVLDLLAAELRQPSDIHADMEKKLRM